MQIAIAATAHFMMPLPFFYSQLRIAAVGCFA